MEYRKRRLEEGSKSESDKESMMEERMDQVTQMIYQIGILSESTLSVITGLIHKVDEMQGKIEGLETTIQRNQGTFVAELDRRDREIAALREMNQRMIADYEEKIRVIEGRCGSSSDMSSYYN